MKDQLNQAIESLKSVLCGPTGKCEITGSDEDRAVVDKALTDLTQLEAIVREQPQYEAGDMADAQAKAFREGVASVTQQKPVACCYGGIAHDCHAGPGCRIRERLTTAPGAQQAEAVQACGHPMSLLLRSAESNEPLYCEACDDKSGRHDAERRETELLDANRRLQEKIGSADALKLHAIEELCQLGYTVKDGELFPPDHLHKLMEAANHPLCGKQTEAVPSSALNPDESDSVTLWAEIWRLREAVKGPDGYATWQDAATAERIRRVRAESKQAEASALIERMADALRSCSGVPHWPSFQPLINEASKWKVEAVPPDVVRDADVEAAAKKMAEIFDYPWDFMPEKGRNTMRENVRTVLDAAIAQQKGGV